MSKHDLEIIAECHPDPERRERARSQLHDRPLTRGTAPVAMLLGRMDRRWDPLQLEAQIDALLGRDDPRPERYLVEVPR